jgi:TolA-binding protein
MRAVFVAVVALLGLFGPAAAQTGAPAAPSAEQLAAEIEFFKAETNQLRTEANTLRGALEKLNSENQALRGRIEALEAPINAKQLEADQRRIEAQSRLYAKYVEAKQREYDFAAEMMTVNNYTFQHQYVAAYVILALVVGVVISGLWFAYVQLMAGLAPALAARRAIATAGETRSTDPAAATLPAADVPGPAPLSSAVPFGATTIDASLDKVTVTSSVVGVVVLIISLAFLYIYTKEIYAIKVIDPYQPKLQDPTDLEPQKK